MVDLIDRHEAIDIVRNIIVKEVTPAYMLIDKAEVMTELMMMPPAQPEITDEQAIEHLRESGWMQNHDKQMHEMGLREQLADDSDSYDAILPSAQPELARINDCNGCKFIGCYDTDFPCANCVRKDKDYYESEG